MLFLYGGSDPWTGGAYEIGTQADVVKVTAAAQPHGVLLKDLSAADRELAKLESWVGARPNLDTPGPTPRPAMPWMR